MRRNTSSSDGLRTLLLGPCVGLDMDTHSELTNFYTKLGFALNWWQMVESALSIIFLRLTEANPEAGSAAFFAAVNFNAKLAMTDAAAHVALGGKKLEAWAELQKSAAKLVEKRNDLVHFQLDSDDSQPEGQRHRLQPNMFASGSKKRFRGPKMPSYVLKDVEDISSKFRKLQHALNKFSKSLRLPSPQTRPSPSKGPT